jgi:hypothetical protein
MQSSFGHRSAFYAGLVLFASAMLEQLGNILGCELQHLAQ